MAIRINCYNIIIPIANLSKCEKIKNLKGILNFYAKENKLKSVWHDNYLVTIGGIAFPEDVENEALILEKLGLTLIEEKNGEKIWKDLCVADFIQGPTLKCPWLETEINPFNVSTSCAWLKGTEKGDIIDETHKRKINLLKRLLNIWR